VTEFRVSGSEVGEVGFDGSSRREFLHMSGTKR
jgi:hypothetical protein